MKGRLGQEVEGGLLFVCSGLLFVFLALWLFWFSLKERGKHDPGQY